ncbi:MAG: ABC transporter substrate-binding protein [Roseibium album]|uniref:Sulfate starvation-induced protein 1 n=1 Tax=Roseibium album TaxID=311410 RepID=A0A0M7AW94_9HYPH|nr:ABC transporter substrate-binding protein [Roseibium album]MBG6148045.1 taurine transport system substrate-binding protein [Labrenzia sp. EL_142]MBG6154588.1 taurine transport system substrate-binding protein [Labrenzia sp. EL_162]MBG6161866.1 taurine transport system substrate-binding protein [Labrenzia sp. EL_195]MBG6193282.1 taurine transport system substrate-binding protein [Labrenzia sp. EL_159]MBG6199648.1 taurine transport system substrate-binding protein [Labrenzia sp. EL_13]MBG621
MTYKSKLIGSLAALAFMSGLPATSAAQELTVAYFLEWPMPFQYAKEKGHYEEALGVPINWVSFDTGTAMSAAMASGDVQIAVSQGVPPFVVAASAGQDLILTDIAVSYSENDNCVVAEALEIDKNNAKELEGKQVGVPIGTAAHYGFLSQMKHFGVDISTMEIVDMAPADGAAAFAQGSLDMVCGWGGALRRMVEHGNVLLTGAEKEELGILVFDGISVPADFAAEESEMLTKFLKVTAEANAMWNAGENKAEMIEVIAKDAGMDVDATEATLATFTFPNVEDKLSDKWMGGNVQTFMLGVADVFQEAGSIPQALDSYVDAVDSSYLAATGTE